MMKNSPINIKRLIQELAENDSEKALASIYSIYSRDMARYIFMFVKSKEVTEELLSDLFYTIWESRKSLSHIDHFKAYLYKVAKYKALNFLRTPRTSSIALDEIALDFFSNTKTTVEDEYISEETVQKINRAIETLPDKCKQAFKFVREDRMKYQEAAELLGISVKTVENHIRLAVKRIKEQLETL